jgi:NifU-like protein
MHCSVLGHAALDAAVNNYFGNDAAVIEEKRKNIVCECFGVTEEEILRIVKENGLTSVEDVTNYTKAGGGCMSCHEKIRELIKSVVRAVAKTPESPSAGKKLTNLQKIKLIEETFEKEIRPMLKADGGDIELVDIEGSKVIVSLRGMCSSCSTSNFTLKNYIEPKLKEFVGDDIYIEEAKQ